MNDLSDIALLIPSRSAPSRMVSRLTIEPATARGARLIPECGVTDVALARNLLVGKALAALQSDPRPVVVWIDDDTIVEPSQLAALAFYASHYQAGISARYVSRSDPNRLASTLLEDAPPLHGPGGDFLPAYSGLGCLALPTSQLQRLAESSPLVTWESPTETRSFPAVMACGPVRNHEGIWGWCSEDYWFCERLWSEASGVYLSPIAVGHCIHGDDSPAVYPNGNDGCLGSGSVPE